MSFRWFFPTESGDIRLEGVGATETRLIVTDPTPREIVVLTKLLTTGRKQKWIDPTVGIPTRTGTYTLEVSAPIRDVATVLLGKRRTPPGVISALVYADGSTTATLDGAELPVPEGAKPPEKKPAAAATIPRPTLCCPIPWEGPDQRASEVLKAFCTPDEWDEWIQCGMIHVVGNLTGHTYRVVHRHHALARRQGKITWDETSDSVVHAHLAVLPPPEEVLSVKLTLQYGEDWIRNPSGYFGRGPRFPHPLGLGCMEGIWSAGLIAGLAPRSGWQSGRDYRTDA